MKNTLEIKNVSVILGQKRIVDNISCSFQSGKTYAIMGPNGSGKSTFVKSIAGVLEESLMTKGKILLNNTSIQTLDAYKRSQRGIFLSFQSPVAIPGVSVVDILRASYEEKVGKRNVAKAKTSVAGHLITHESLGELTQSIKSTAKKLGINEELLYRGIHDGFSGGERKKIQILQAIILHPLFAYFDEIDTGLDVDALKIIGKSVAHLKESGTTVILITHSQRILSYIKPDRVFIFSKGCIVKIGNSALIQRIEQNGYEQFG